MDLSTILSISGKPGLYKLISQTKTGALVESLLDSKRYPAFSNEKISSLADISIFTIDDDISLQEALQAIYRKENGGECINHKASENEIIAYMKEVLQPQAPMRGSCKVHGRFRHRACLQRIPCLA